MTPEEFNQLKVRIERLKREYHKSRGSLETLLLRMKDETECSTIEELRDKITLLKAKLDKKRAMRQKKWEEFESKWKDKLTSQEMVARR